VKFHPENCKTRRQQQFFDGHESFCNLLSNSSPVVSCKHKLNTSSSKAQLPAKLIFQQFWIRDIMFVQVCQIQKQKGRHHIHVASKIKEHDMAANVFWNSPPLPSQLSQYHHEPRDCERINSSASHTFSMLAGGFGRSNAGTACWWQNLVSFVLNTSRSGISVIPLAKSVRAEKQSFL